MSYSGSGERPPRRARRVAEGLGWRDLQGGARRSHWEPEGTGKREQRSDGQERGRAGQCGGKWDKDSDGNPGRPRWERVAFPLLPRSPVAEGFHVTPLRGSGPAHPIPDPELQAPDTSHPDLMGGGARPWLQPWGPPAAESGAFSPRLPSTFLMSASSLHAPSGR